MAGTYQGRTGHRHQGNCRQLASPGVNSAGAFAETRYSWCCCSRPKNRKNEPMLIVAGTILAAMLTTAAPSPVIRVADLTDELTQCVIPKIQYGEYSSYDGGKSAKALLNACSSEWIAFVHDCRRETSLGANCAAVGLILVQSLLQRFGK
jgi:hypothetical protein